MSSTGCMGAAGCSTSPSFAMDGNEGTDGTESAGKVGRSEGTDGKEFHGELDSLGPGLEGPASFLFDTVPSELDVWGFTSPTALVPITHVTHGNASESNKPN